MLKKKERREELTFPFPFVSVASSYKVHVVEVLCRRLDLREKKNNICKGTILEKNELRAKDDADGGARHGAQRRAQLTPTPRNLLPSSPLPLPLIPSA